MSRQKEWGTDQTNAQGESSKALSHYPIYLLLEITNKERQTAYRELFRFQLEPGIIDNIRKATNGNFVMSLQNKPFHVMIHIEVQSANTVY